MFFREKKYLIPYVETHITDHCNLNCAYCGHYAYLVDKEVFVDLNQFVSDLEVLFKKVYFKKIRIMGGEPLLHPQVSEFLAVTRKIYRYSDIHIVTNGILLPTMDEKFWDTVRTNNIKIDLSKYPILGNKFSELLDLIDDKRAMLGNITLSKRFYDKLNLNGNSDKEKAFNACFSKVALNLWNQRLYTCQACYRDYYNKKYNTNIILPASVDIYKATPKEIYNIFNKPNDGCKYCKIISDEYEWHKYEIE